MRGKKAKALRKYIDSLTSIPDTEKKRYYRHVKKQLARGL
jgi:hypothetical protein